MHERLTVPRWVDIAVVAATVAALLKWTWRTWPDPLVDFGREMYIAWQLSLGKSLYGKNAYFDGPLAPYVNAAAMKVFGPNLTVIFVVNFVVLIATLFLLHRLVERMAGRLAALTGVVLVAAICGFGRLTVVGNYNFMAPYSEQYTYGFLLCIAALACVHLPSRLQSKTIAAAGVLTGLVLLTKVEFALAAIVSVPLALWLRTRDDAGRNSGRTAAIFGLGVIAPVVTAFALLTVQLPPTVALRGTLGSIYWVFASHLSSLPFYRASMGTDHVATNLGILVVGLLLLAVCAAVATGAGVAARKWPKLSVPAAATITFVATSVIAFYALRTPQWFGTSNPLPFDVAIGVPKAFPVVVLIALGFWVRAYLRRELAPAGSRALALRITFAVFALALLGKMILNARLFHYGFVLGIPAALILVGIFVSWLPSFSERFQAEPAVTRAVSIAVMLQFAMLYVSSMAGPIARQQFAVGAGANRLMADNRGEAEQVVLRWIEANTAKDATIVVMPQGAMINFLSERANPTPHSTFMPAEMLVFGQDKMLGALEQHPPDFIVLAHTETTEFGVPLFGRDYAKNIGSWVSEHYTPVEQVGETPLREVGKFGVIVLRRKP